MNKKLLMMFFLSSFVFYLGCNTSRVSTSSSSTQYGGGDASTRFSTTDTDVIFSIGDRVGVIEGQNIKIMVPFGTDLTALIPTIKTSADFSVSPASGIAQDFTNPVMYTVTATDGSTKSYTVTAIVPSAGDKMAFTADGVNFNFAYVPGGLTFATSDRSNTNPTVANAYWIGETVVTYELWNTVYTWAIANGYAFANPGLKGNSGTGNVTQPVTNISWRDAIIFSNAITEWNNAKNGTSYDCVYYSDAAYTTPIRTSTDGDLCSTLGCEDRPYVKADANGFRLLSDSEWELAAKYIGTTAPTALPLAAEANTTVVDGVTYYWTPDNYASGATADFTDAEATGAVAWYGYNSGGTTHDVKSNIPNQLGLYGMSGNVMQWTSELCSSGRGRLFRGGSGYPFIADLQVIFMNQYSYFGSSVKGGNLGLRLARTDF